jgi:DNA-binding response OmpR family regulator
VELLARVRSQLRRYTQLGGSQSDPEPAIDPSVVRVGGICLCDKQKSVTLDGEPVSLTPTEYDILHFLMRHPGEVFSPKELYRRVWDNNPFGAENTVAVHIRHLREKLEINPSEPRWLKVVWGQGYKMEPDTSHKAGGGAS